VHVEQLPARAARFGETASPLSEDVAARLRTRGIEQLWAHQAEAIDLLRDGEDVVVATGTASGKSLCYQVPILESVLSGSRDTALLLFPTKALGRDQLRSIRSWLVSGLRAVAYDGDTPEDDRAWARRHANVVFTNPDMLHVGILPAHERWRDFLARLRWVVVDELHVLRGIFGSHVAHVLRRLRRLCDHYGSSPTFCFSSATIGNPTELASELSGQRVRGVTDNAAPRSARAFGCWQRPFLDETATARVSANRETADLLAEFVAAGFQTLAFTRSRRGAEVVARLARERLQERAPALAECVAAYRAGYLPAERRELEARLTSGALRGIAATTALELGIDVGGLDAVIVNGFPGTLASLWQQAGRAGRGHRRAAATLVAGDDQLDQWYVRHPNELFTRAPEAAVVNTDNPFVLHDQLRCAVHELPLTPDDESFFGPGLDDAVLELVRADELRPRGRRLFWAGGSAPAARVGLRSGGTVEYELFDQDEELVGTVDGGRVFRVAHPGAIYLHQGRQFRVRRLDLQHHVAELEPADECDEYTQARIETEIEVRHLEREHPVGAADLHLGTVDVTNTPIAYQRRRASTRELLGIEPLELPPTRLSTRAVWYTMSRGRLVAGGLEPARLLGTVHAAEHALIGMLPRFAICDRWDVGGVSMAEHPATSTPAVFVYDGYDGGAGIAELAYEAAERHVRETLALVQACPCTDGCPSCVHSPKCGNWNEHLDKAGAVAFLDAAAG